MTRVIATSLLAVVMLVAACGGDKPPVRTDPVWYDDLIGAPDDTRAGWPDAVACDPMPGAVQPGGHLVMALGEAVLPARAPVPGNTAERVVFAALYETLTTVACTGELAAGLAVSWTPFEDGRRWLLRLRPGAVFWDGTPVDARAVLRSWQRNLELTAALGRPCPGLWLEPTGRGMTVRGPDLLEIRLAEPQQDLPRLLAHPALAVAAVRDGWTWPVGSGPGRLAADSDHPLPDLTCRPNRHHPDPPVWQSLTFRITAGADARDLLAEGVDIALIRDWRATDFYAELPGVRSAALPWDRKYVLLVPPDVEIPSTLGARFTSAGTTVARSRDTDRLVFRHCRPTSCPQLHGPTVGVITPPTDRDPALIGPDAIPIHHAGDDADAAALAARTAALLPGRPPLRAESIGSLARSIQRETRGAFVVRLEACYPAPCLTVAALVAHADWLQSAFTGHDPCEALRQLTDGGRVIPLADTGADLVWRGPLAGLALAHDGTPLLATIGVAASEVQP